MLRVPHALVLLLCLLLLPPPPAAAARATPSAALVIAPAEVPADGSPFAAVVEVRGEPGRDVELRVTALSGSVPLARAWVGAAWAPPGRYAIAATLDAAGEWRGVVPLALSKSAPDGAALTIAARARYVGGEPGVEARAPAFARASAWAAAVPALAEREVALLVADDGTVAAVARASAVVPLLVASAAPRGALRVMSADGSIVAEAPAPALPALRVARVDAAGDAVTIEARDDAPLAGVCVTIGRESSCFERGSLSRGERRSVALRVADARGAARLSLGPVTLDEAAFDPASALVAQNAEGARVLAQGESAFATTSFVPLVLPEDGYAALASIVTGATRTLDVATYTLTSLDAARLLAAAATRGVAVRVLADDGPVGGFAPEEHDALAALVAAGVDARLSSRHAAMHAKLLVADGEVVLVASENLNAGS